MVYKKSNHKKVHLFKIHLVEKKGEGKDNKRGTSGVKGNNFFAETSLKLFSEEKKQWERKK